MQPTSEIDESAELTEVVIQQVQGDKGKKKEVEQTSKEVREKVPEQKNTQVSGQKQPRTPFP